MRQEGPLGPSGPCSFSCSKFHLCHSLLPEKSSLGLEKHPWTPGSSNSQQPGLVVTFAPLPSVLLVKTSRLEN